MAHYGHHHHQWGHHHRHHGRGPGVFILPFLPLVIGMFLLLFLFKTGLWIPLVLIGAFMFFMRPRGGMSRWCGMSREDWGGMRDKMKNEWQGWQERDDTIITSEKPKRSGEASEFV